MDFDWQQFFINFQQLFFGSILLNKLPIAFHNEHRKWYRRFPFSFFPYGFSQILLYSVWKNCIPHYTNEFPATFEACVNRITIFQPVFPLKTVGVFVNVCLLFVFSLFHLLSTHTSFFPTHHSFHTSFSVLYQPTIFRKQCIRVLALGHVLA